MLHDSCYVIHVNMKILLVNNYWYVRGGAERVLLHTKKLLEQAGHTVAVFGMQHEKNLFQNGYFAEPVDFSLRGFSLLKSVVRSIYNVDAKKRFTRLLTEFRPDVVHFHNIYHHLSFSLVDATKDLCIPSVMTLHDYKLLNPNYKMYHHGKIDETPVVDKYYKTLFQNTFQNISMSLVAMVEAYVRDYRDTRESIDFFIAPSLFVKSLWNKVGWSTKKLAVVPYPVMVDSAPPKFSGNGYVLFTGRLVEEKGVWVFLEAARLLPSIPFRIIGDGPLRQEVESYIRVRGVSNVTYVPWLESKDLTAAIVKSCIVTVPSLWYETSSLVGLEAMSIGKIVIGSDVGALREVISAPFRVAPNDAVALAREIERWYHTPRSEREEIGSRLREHVINHHDPNTYIQQVLGVYEQVVSERKSVSYA